MNKATKGQEEKALRFITFCVRRLQTDLTEEQIAAKLGFRSPEVLYKQLELDRSPVCGVCGRLYPEPDHHKEHKQKRRTRQPGVGGGRRVKLPDASNARNLFRRAIEDLDEYLAFVDVEESWLEGNLEEGQFKGKHFITHSAVRDAREVAVREEFTEEQWRELCEQHGADPASDQVVLSVGEATAGGVERTPSGFLTALIAAYALAHQPLTPLIEALHYEPDSVARDELNDNAYELRKVAGHLAARVRRGVVERGRGIEEISREVHFAAWLIGGFEEEGLSSDEEIHEQIRKTFPSFADGLTPKEIDRIRRERLDPPH
jgi:hypothetical protein